MRAIDLFRLPGVKPHPDSEPGAVIQCANLTVQSPAVPSFLLEDMRTFAGEKARRAGRWGLRLKTRLLIGGTHATTKDRLTAVDFSEANAV